MMQNFKEFENTVDWLIEWKAIDQFFQETKQNFNSLKILLIDWLSDRYAADQFFQETKQNFKFENIVNCLIDWKALINSSKKLGRTLTAWKSLSKREI